MVQRQKRSLTRITTVMLTTSVALGGGLLAAGAAVAADGPGAGVTAVVQNKMFGEKVDVEGKGAVDAGLFTLKTASGEELRTYCIDFDNPVYLNSGAKYHEADWSASSLNSNANAPQIRWILDNSYPHVQLAKLRDAIGDADLSEEDAAAGTQTAIWKFSDGKTATPRNEHAKKLRDYLTGDANKGVAAEPKPSLTLTPDSVTGKAGGKLGPFVLNSSANAVKLAVSGDAADKIKVLDKDGKAVSGALTGPIGKDTQLFLDVPAGTPDGKAALSASADTSVLSGRVFMSDLDDAGNHSQTMILADSIKVSVAAEAKATWKQGTGALVDSSAKVECANGGVRVTVNNAGDQPATVTVGKQQVTVQPGKSENVLVKVAEKAHYEIAVAGPNGYTKTFTGTLDCKTGVTPTGAPTTPAATGTPTAGPSTAAAHPAPSTTSAAPGTGGLAQTGASSNTPIIAGVAGALVVAGGASVFFLRRRGRHGRTTA
ncbi:hypothetical protein VM98_07420 [Streptomyces rubellomurinus subsp. indigoferus]|nr:hypothetical protein VM98_07420 [Streptomyces rubellomurinus subsp. indigoferus]